MRGGHPSAARAVVVVAALTVAWSAAGCTTAADGTDAAVTSETVSTIPPTFSDDPRVALGDELLPPPLTGDEATAMSDECLANGTAHLHGAPETADFEPRTAADGSFERSFGGVNPRVETSEVDFEAPPTDAQRQAADEFVEEVRVAVAENGWDVPSNVVADGYRPMQRCNFHLVNVEAVFDGVQMDPERPEFIVLAPDPDGTMWFHSVMFLVESNEGHGDQPFGAMAPWHYHETPACMIDGVLVVPGRTDSCPEGTAPYERTPEMLHVKVTGNPFDPGM